MRTLRFSAVLTVFFVTTSPILIGAIIGGVFFLYHILSHLGGELNIQHAFNIWLLTIFHGFAMYAIPSFILGIIVMFLLDKGMPRSRFLPASLIVATIMAIWAYTTVDYKVIMPVFIVLIASAIGSYFLLLWISVPKERRTVPPVFDGLQKNKE